MNDKKRIIMKHIFIIFVFMTFYCTFPAAHNATFFNVRRERMQILWEEFLADRLQLHDIPWEGIDEWPAQRRQHTRRGDRHKKPIRTQYPQYNHRNNRVDRAQHAQFNRYIKQPHGKSI